MKTLKEIKSLYESIITEAKKEKKTNEALFVDFKVKGGDIADISKFADVSVKKLEKLYLGYQDLGLKNTDLVKAMKAALKSLKELQSKANEKQ